MVRITSILFISLFATFFGCNEEQVPTVKTLYDVYPDYRNLTWLSTNGNENPLTANPQLSINIGYKSNEITLLEKIESKTWSHIYKDLNITLTTLTFLNPEYKGSVVREYILLPPPDSTKIKLSYLDNIYILRKN